MAILFFNKDSSINLNIWDYVTLVRKTTFQKFINFNSKENDLEQTFADLEAYKHKLT